MDINEEKELLQDITKKEYKEGHIQNINNLLNTMKKTRKAS